MNDFNQQIIQYWDTHRVPTPSPVSRRDVEAAMADLKFGRPVENESQMTEVVDLCCLWESLKGQTLPESARFTIDPPVAHISLSVTERCGHMCRHCSTNASPASHKGSVPFARLRKALAKMCPYTQVLYIACEGDPFFYRDEDKSILEVVRLILDLGFPCLSFQCLVPDDRGLAMLHRLLIMLESLDTSATWFHPQISFNLYAPRSGSRIRPLNGPSSGPAELCIPGIASEDARDWVLALLDGSAGARAQAPDAADALTTYFRQLQETVLAFADQGYRPRFELRGSDGLGLGSLTLCAEVLDRLLTKLAEQHPEIDWPRCPDCARIHYAINSAAVVPVGRATQFFVAGDKAESQWIKSHVLENPNRFLCPNWTSWGRVTIDTAGFPQLCYSNAALSVHLRTTTGPNLYSPEGFESMRQFYMAVWESRGAYLRENLPRLVQQRANQSYCPSSLFEKTVSEFASSRDDHR
jgi:hypothetical protein